MLRNKATALGFALTLVASGLSAQTRTGSISGTVRDATSQVLPGVSVTLEGPTLVTAQVTSSSDAGLYRFINLPPGTYDIRAELSGFQSITLQAIRVDIARNTPVDIAMQLATVAETVTVIGESPLVDVKSTVTGASFDEQLLAEVPSARDVWSVLEHQAPGVTHEPPRRGRQRNGAPGALFRARHVVAAEQLLPEWRQRHLSRGARRLRLLLRLRQLRGNSGGDGKPSRFGQRARRLPEHGDQDGRQRVPRRGHVLLPELAARRATTSPTSCERGERAAATSTISPMPTHRSAGRS